MKKVNLTTSGINAILMQKALETMGNIAGNPRFSIAVARNLGVLNPVVDQLKKGLDKPEAFQQYEKEVKELFESVATPNARKQMEVSDEAWPAYKANLDELKKKHQAAIDARDEQIKKYESILEEDLEEMQMYPIAEDKIPDAVLYDTLQSCSAYPIGPR